MKELVKNTLLYFSAFVPMYFLILVKFAFGFLSGTIEPNPLTVFTVTLYFVFILLGLFGLYWNTFLSSDKSVTITIQDAQNITDQHFLNYFSLFVLFALTFELTKPSMFMVSLFIILFVGVVYVNNQMFYINPLLNLLGYNFYTITYQKQNSNTPCTAKMFV